MALRAAPKASTVAPQHLLRAHAKTHDERSRSAPVPRPVAPPLMRPPNVPPGHQGALVTPGATPVL
eukprot:5984454-Heterocapsa_arctica.AAC.1